MAVFPTDKALQEIPPAVWQALTHHVQGNKWGKSAELAGIDLRTLNKYRDLPECIKFHNDQGKEYAIQGRNVAFKLSQKLWIDWLKLHWMTARELMRVMMQARQ